MVVSSMGVSIWCGVLQRESANRQMRYATAGLPGLTGQRFATSWPQAVDRDCPLLRAQGVNRGSARKPRGFGQGQRFRRRRLEIRERYRFFSYGDAMWIAPEAVLPQALPPHTSQA